MKNDFISKIVLIGIIIIFIVFIIFSIITIENKDTSKLLQGESSFAFCEKVCKDYDVLSSNNNSQYNFIRCECLIEVQVDAFSYTRARTKTITNIYYFDSNSFQEISKKEAIKRISVET
ncbi:hypothetical protein ACFLZF_00215 [Nanoarchaeota archaeon]